MSTELYCIQYKMPLSGYTQNELSYGTVLERCLLAVATCAAVLAKIPLYCQKACIIGMHGLHENPQAKDICRIFITQKLCTNIIGHRLTVGSPAVPRCPFSILFSLSSVSFSDFISWNELASCCFSIIIF